MATSVLREGGVSGMVAKAMKGVKGEKGTRAGKSNWQKKFEKGKK
jgi:hypothetical protein